VERDVKHPATSRDFELKPQKPDTQDEHHPFEDEDEHQLEQERLRRRGNSVLGIMPLETKGRNFEVEKGKHVDNPFGDSHEVSKPDPPRNDQSSEGSAANLSASMPDSAASSSYVSVEESKEFTPYGSIHSTPPDQISQSPLMQPVSPRHTASEPWRFEDSSFIEPDEEDEALEYQSVNNSLQLPRARGHSNTTVSSSSSWSDIEPSAHQARSDVSDSDISIISKDKASHSSHSTSEDEDGFVDVASHGSRSA
jgi:hypothetical protein